MKTDCKEWSNINRLHTDVEDYFIIFGCENGDDNSHYVGLWIFIREYTRILNTEGLVQHGPPMKIGKEEETAIQKKIHKIIDTNYSDIKQDIKFIPNWSDETNCVLKEYSMVMH